MPCLKTASCLGSHGGHQEPHFYFFFKVFPILSVWIFMINLLHKRRDLFLSNQNTWTDKICLTALRTARNTAFSVLSPLFPPRSPELGDLFRFSSLLIALWVECLFKYSLLGTLFFWFFFTFWSFVLYFVAMVTAIISISCSADPLVFLFTWP